MLRYVFVATGGALGSVARYWVGTVIAGRVSTLFPYGTFVVNLTACVIVGFSLTWMERRTNINPAWRLLVPIGFVGGYSTFSALEWETFVRLEAGAFAVAGLYVAFSVVLGLFAIWLGATLAR